MYVYMYVGSIISMLLHCNWSHVQLAVWDLETFISLDP